MTGAVANKKGNYFLKFYLKFVGLEMLVGGLYKSRSNQTCI